MELQSKVFFKDKENGWETMWEGIERKIIGYDEKLMLVKVRFTKGTTAPAHHHVHSQVAYIAEGRFEVEIGDKTDILAAGDGFYIPSGVVHSVKALEDGLILDSFSPAREDFLE